MKHVIPPTESYEALGAAYRRYVAHLEQQWNCLPPGLKEFVMQDWYYMFPDPRCPHDSVFRSLKTSGPVIELSFFSYKHDTLLTFNYDEVIEFNMVVPPCEDQDMPVDFLYDEFNVSAESELTHEIRGSNGSEVLVRFAGDVRYRQEASRSLQASGTAS